MEPLKHTTEDDTIHLHNPFTPSLSSWYGGLHPKETWPRNFNILPSHLWRLNKPLTTPSVPRPSLLRFLHNVHIVLHFPWNTELAAGILLNYIFMMEVHCHVLVSCVNPLLWVHDHPLKWTSRELVKPDITVCCLWQNAVAHWMLGSRIGSQ